MVYIWDSYAHAFKTMSMDEITEEMRADREEVQGLGLDCSSVGEMSKN